MVENRMNEIRLEKVVLNIGCGGDLEKIEKAKSLLEYLTSRKPVITLSKKRSTFGIAKGKPVGVKVTLRKDAAYNFLKQVLESLKFRIKKGQFDKDGNFSVGIKEYIDLPNVRYKHEIGMLGFDATFTFYKPGYRIKYRKREKKKIPKKHKINKEEVMNWLKERFGVEFES